MIVHLIKIIHSWVKSARNKLLHTFLLDSLHFMHCKKFYRDNNLKLKFLPSGLLNIRNKLWLQEHKSAKIHICNATGM